MTRQQSHTVIPPTLADYADFVARAGSRLKPLPPRPPGQPLVSIITVCRNAATTLPATMDSVQAQTYPWIEHIVIDGASIDNTQAILDQNQRLAGWISEPDRGISDAFNKGIALSRGQFIGILNADDVWLPETAARSIAALSVHPEFAWSFGGCDFTLHGERVLHQSADPNYDLVIRKTMPRINHPTVVMRAAAYADYGVFRTDLRLAMDYDLLLRFYIAGLRGVALDHTLAVMALGGVSCRQILGAYREAASVSVDHGRHPLPAYLERISRSFLPSLRLVAQDTPLPRWRQALRRRHKRDL